MSNELHLRTPIPTIKKVQDTYAYWQFNAGFWHNFTTPVRAFRQRFLANLTC